MKRHLKTMISSLIGCMLLFDVSPGHAQTPDTDADQARPFVQGGIYDKPFITRLGGRTSIGGYGDFEFRAEREEGITEEVAMRLHRFNLFTYSVISDRIRVSSEIEFENGGEEIVVEYGVVDIEFREELNFRAGIILSPLGKFNLSHDSPQNELTDRPLVVTEIIPSTLSEGGAGFWGALYPSPATRITYELYAVNGFNEGIISSGQTRIGEGEGSLEEDNNTRPAAVGRIAVSPLRGLEIGGSFHTGQYNVSSEDGVTIASSDHLTILGTDWAYRRGPFHFVGEYAHASIDIPGGLTNFLAERQQGVYVQAGYRFLTGLSSTFPNSSLTGVVRYDGVDFDTAIDGDSEQRVTLGVNLRPIEDTILKFDYQVNRSRDGVNNKTAGRAFLFSVATYF